MTYSISETVLSQFSEFVASRMGLHFPRERWGDLERGLRSVLHDHPLDDVESFLRSLRSTPFTKQQVESLASHLTIGETYFFREGKSFEILEEHILPELVRSRQETCRSIRIWSAGCCTGEEPYSIAMALDRAFPQLKDWNLTILATDINPKFLKKAELGVYQRWSFRGASLRMRDRYFESDGKEAFAIRSDIKEMVTFFYLNLADDVYPSLTNNTNAMDIIFCRNVLMYFTPDHARKVIHNFFRSLVDGGWLIISPSETSQALFGEFATVNFKEGIFYRKGGVQDGSTQVPQFIFLPEIEPPTSRGEFPAEIPPGEQGIEAPVFQPESVPQALHESDERKVQKDEFEEALELYQLGSYDAAAQKIIGFLNKHTDARSIPLLVRILANQGKLIEAKHWCEQAIASDKLNPLHRYLLATILEEQGCLDEAAASLKQALYLNHEFVLAYFALGNLSRRRGNFKDAEKHFRNTLALLRTCRQDEIVPDSEGITAGRLGEIIESSYLLNK